MTISSTSTRQDYTAGGATTAFVFTFKTYAAAHVEVFLNGAKQFAGYAVALNADQDTSPGGTVTFAVAPVADTTVRIQRTVPLTQETALSAYAAFPSESVEKRLDQSVQQVQQLKRDVDDYTAQAAAAAAAPGNATPVTALGSTHARTLAGRFSDTINVKDYGAKGDDATDDTAAIQAAITAAIAGKGEVVFPNGTYLVTGELDFTDISPVANGTPFGLTVRGQGMGTVIKTTAAAGSLFNFDAGVTDLQIRMSGLHCYCTTGGVIGLRLGKMSRYSSFDGIRLVGFKEGIRLQREAYGVIFRDLYIRYCVEEAIVVDTAELGAGVLTEFKFFGGYIDDNQTGTADGGAYVPTLYLRNVQEWKFYGTVFEGNNGGGVQIEGASHNVAFHGCRFEETLMRFGASGHIHNIAAGVYNVDFVECELAYDKNGIGGGKSYQLMLVPAGAGPVRLLNCQILDMSDTAPTDTFGTSPATAQIEVAGLLNGNGAGDHTISVSPRYLGAVVGASRHAFGATVPASGTWVKGDIVWATDPTTERVAGWVCTANGTPGTWMAIRTAYYNAAAPAAGTWIRGDITWNNSPDLGEPVGWVCTVAGTPGTWQAIPGPGVSQADSVAADVPGLVTDFNALLGKLRATGALAP